MYYINRIKIYKYKNGCLYVFINRDLSSYLGYTSINIYIYLKLILLILSDMMNN